MTLAFAPFSQWYVAIIGMLALSWLWLRPETTRPGLTGFFFGLGYFGVGLHWVYISLYSFGGAALSFAIFANIILILFLALFPMVTGWLLGKISRSATLLRMLLIPFLWCLGELARAYILTGFPWLSLGYSQLGAPLDGLAPITGVFGISLAVAMIASLIAYAWITHQKAPILFALIILATVYISRTLHFTNPVGNRLSVALVQGNIAQTIKFNPAHMLEGLEKYVTLSANRHESVIIWPETAIPFLESDVTDSHIKELNTLFLSKNQTLVTGIPSGSWEEERFFNSVIALGRGEGRYDKHHLLPFGEFIPMRTFLNFFNDFVEIPFNDFSRGDAKQPPMITNGIRAGVSICFEAAFGRDIRHAMPEAQYLINISNDSWFKDSIAADQHLQMAQMRSRELERETARATNDGITTIIDARGNLRKRLPRFEAAVLSGYIQPHIGTTPYARYGNTIFVVMMALYAMMLGLFTLTLRSHASTVPSQHHRT
ncbi:apolipoprotein N-acyltransferase [Cardiobacteriaceae bacterium TAE3-ERU3]|nr:apolipoprotein N-acyltransferase [Cardiobacteriaceae bacterium TAE3-ERU3]